MGGMHQDKIELDWCRDTITNTPAPLKLSTENYNYVELENYIAKPSIKFWRGKDVSPRQKTKTNWRLC
jgi:hypothetical protein